MINTELSPHPTSPALRTLGWVGLWLCSASFFPFLTAWAHFWAPQKHMNLPHPGTSFFWILVGSNVLGASLMTFSIWSDQRKPKRRLTAPAPADAKSRWRDAGSVGVLVGFLVLYVMAETPGMSVNWIGILGGIAAGGVLMALFGQCTRMVTPPQLEEPKAVGPLSPPVAPTVPLGVCPPKNKYRAEVNARGVVYHRPLSQHVGMGLLSLFCLVMCAGTVWVSLLSMQLIGVPGGHRHPNLALALMMGVGFVFLLISFLSVLMTAGPRVLRVSPSDGTYVYRLAAPVPWPMVTKLIAGELGRRNRDETGLPWRIIEHLGQREDMAGVQRLEFIYKSNTSYTVLLCWHDPSRPPMRVGFSTNESKARAMQMQAAEDLGVPLLPDEVV